MAFSGHGPAERSLKTPPVATLVQPFEHWKKGASGAVQRGRNDRARDLLSSAQIEQAKARLKYAGRIPAAVFERDPPLR